MVDYGNAGFIVDQEPVLDTESRFDGCSQQRRPELSSRNHFITSRDVERFRPVFGPSSNSIENVAMAFDQIPTCILEW